VHATGAANPVTVPPVIGASQSAAYVDPANPGMIYLPQHQQHQISAAAAAAPAVHQQQQQHLVAPPPYPIAIATPYTGPVHYISDDIPVASVALPPAYAPTIATLPMAPPPPLHVSGAPVWVVPGGASFVSPSIPPVPIASPTPTPVPAQPQPSAPSIVRSPKQQSRHVEAMPRVQSSLPTNPEDGIELKSLVSLHEPVSSNAHARAPSYVIDEADLQVEMDDHATESAPRKGLLGKKKDGNKREVQPLLA
jgi:hypothetical protein